MKQLRPYQQAAIDSLFDYIAHNPGKNPLVVAPVGAGKSLMMADIVKRIHEQAPRVRIVVLAHVKELLQQNAAELASHYRGVDYGFYCAGLGQKRLHNDVTFASIQSVHDKLLSFNRVPQVLIVDECHLIPTNDATTYRRFIDECKKANHNLVVIGLTGTPFRADSGRLDEGEGRLFDGVAYEIGIRWMIEQGYLCRPATPKMATQLSTDGVGTRAGDYIASQLEKAVDIDATTQACVDELMQHAAGRKKWLVFTAGIEHCTHVRDAIRARGVVAEMLTGDTPKVEREAIIARYKRGEIRALVNVAVLTTGFNVPDIDCLVFMRPTRSPVLYVQCIGRGIRPVYANGHDLSTQQGRLDAIAASGKPDCIAEGQLVLTNYGLVSIEKVTKKMKVWDGVEFVSHCGIIFRGEQDTIEYNGLVATPDHKVWTEKGWKRFDECAMEQIPIKIGENNGHAIKLSENKFRHVYTQKCWWERKTLCLHDMFNLWSSKRKSLGYLQKWNCWLQKVWAKKEQRQTGIRCSKMVNNALHSGQTKMRKPQRQTLQALWSAWHKIQFCKSKLDGGVFNWFGHKSQPRNRQDKQQWELRSGEFKSCKKSHKHEQPKKKLFYQDDACVQERISFSKVCRCYLSKTDWARFFFQRNRKQILQPEIVKTKRRVWDILNAGPRNRFTCQGLIVSNCLLLDFGGVVNELGPVDAIEVRKRPGGGGKDEGEPLEAAPFKRCPSCGNLCAPAQRYCFNCSYSFMSDKLSQRASEKAVISTDSEPEDYQVLSVSVKRHLKREDADRELEGLPPLNPATLKVTYATMAGAFHEWVCFEHHTYEVGDSRRFAWDKAVAWHKQRIPDLRPPITVKEALAMGYPNYAPFSIKVRKEGKYNRIISYDFSRPAQVDIPPPVNEWGDDIPF